MGYASYWVYIAGIRHTTYIFSCTNIILLVLYFNLFESPHQRSQHFFYCVSLNINSKKNILV